VRRRHRNSPLIAHVCEAMAGLRAAGLLPRQGSRPAGHLPEQRLSVHSGRELLRQGLDEIATGSSARTRDGKAAQIRAKTVDVASKDQADAAMNEMRKQVGEAYAGGQPGAAGRCRRCGSSWRNRLGLRAKK